MQPVLLDSPPDPFPYALDNASRVRTRSHEEFDLTARRADDPTSPRSYSERFLLRTGAKGFLPARESESPRTIVRLECPRETTPQASIPARFVSFINRFDFSVSFSYLVSRRSLLNAEAAVSSRPSEANFIPSNPCLPRLQSPVRSTALRRVIPSHFRSLVALWR